MDEKSENITIRDAKRITIPPESKSPVVVTTLKCDLMKIERSQTAKQAQQVCSARGIHEGRSIVPFRTTVTSLPKTPVILHHHTRIAWVRVY